MTPCNWASQLLVIAKVSCLQRVSVVTHGNAKTSCRRAGQLNALNLFLQLRYLQTLSTISAEHNSTIIFPMPINIFRCHSCLYCLQMIFTNSSDFFSEFMKKKVWKVKIIKVEKETHWWKHLKTYLIGDSQWVVEGLKYIHSIVHSLHRCEQILVLVFDWLRIK